MAVLLVGAIISGVQLGRQRAAVLMSLGIVFAGAACEARSSVEAAQTAIVFGQSALATVQPVVSTLQGALAGTEVDTRTLPEGAAPEDVTEVDIQATDSQGRLAQVDARTRAAAATAALAAAARYYPNATIALKVVDAGGSTL